MGRTVAARWVEHWMETPEDIRCFYTLDKPFYRPKA